MCLLCSEGCAESFLLSLEGDLASRLAPGAQVFSAPAHPDAPGVRTPARHVPGMSPSGRWFRGISSAVLCHRIRTGTRGQGASIISTTARPWPCAIHPTTWAASTAVTGVYVEHQSALTLSGSNQLEAQQVNEQITSITTIKRHTAAGRVRRRLRSLKTAGIEVRSSSRTSTSTRRCQWVVIYYRRLYGPEYI